MGPCGMYSKVKFRVVAPAQFSFARSTKDVCSIVVLLNDVVFEQRSFQ